VEALRVKEQEADHANHDLTELQNTFDSKLHNVYSESRCANEELETLRGQVQQMEQSLEISRNNLTETNAELVEAQRGCQNLKEMYEELKKREEGLLEQSPNLNATLETKTKELESNKEDIQKVQNISGTNASDYHIKESQLNAKIAEQKVELERVTKCLTIKAGVSVDTSMLSTFFKATQ
jgi:chromosome segregation ATPase